MFGRAAQYSIRAGRSRVLLALLLVALGIVLAQFQVVTALQSNMLIQQPLSLDRFGAQYLTTSVRSMIYSSEGLISL